MDPQIFDNRKLKNLEQCITTRNTGFIISLDIFEQYILTYSHLRYSIETIYDDSIDYSNLTTQKLISYLKLNEDTHITKFGKYPLKLDILMDKDTQCNNSFVFWGRPCFKYPIYSNLVRISYCTPLKEFNYGNSVIK